MVDSSHSMQCIGALALVLVLTLPLLQQYPVRSTIQSGLGQCNNVNDNDEMMNDEVMKLILVSFVVPCISSNNGQTRQPHFNRCLAFLLGLSLLSLDFPAALPSVSWSSLPDIPRSAASGPNLTTSLGSIFGRLELGSSAAVVASGVMITSPIVIALTKPLFFLISSPGLGCHSVWCMICANDLVG